MRNVLQRTKENSAIDQRRTTCDLTSRSPALWHTLEAKATYQEFDVHMVAWDIVVGVVIQNLTACTAVQATGIVHPQISSMCIDLVPENVHHRENSFVGKAAKRVIELLSGGHRVHRHGRVPDNHLGPGTQRCRHLRVLL